MCVCVCVCVCVSVVCRHYRTQNIYQRFKVILKLGRDTTTPLPLYVVRGISTLQVMRPLAGKVIVIPEIPNTLTAQAVNELLAFRWGRFSMPTNPNWLVFQLSTADLLGDEDFIMHIVDILHVHPKKLRSSI